MTTSACEDEEFMKKCEELLKDRYTEKDEEFMKICNKEVSVPPIVENWYVPSGPRRGDNYNRHSSNDYNRSRDHGPYGNNRRSEYHSHSRYHR